MARNSNPRALYEAPLILLLALLVSPAGGAEEDRGQTVAVVYNSASPDSKNIAEHYREQRQVPANQVFGFNLPTTEQMTRDQFRNNLQEPLFKQLKKAGLFLPAPGSKEPGKPPLRQSKIRYLVLCYGVPVKIAGDPNLKENGSDKLLPELRRNEAAVDSELALLPMAEKKFPTYGPLRNPFFTATNAALFHPTNGILMVARLDGPSPAVALGLVDKAIRAEREGLWGRAYFDARGLTNSYKQGDDWIRAAAEVTRQLGYEVVMDERPESFPASFPMSQVAFYAGWYEPHVTGPFLNPRTEFMPGAFAYHLHSFSAHVLRTSNQYWTGPLLERGATVTIGFVEEPYLEATVDLGCFFWRFLFLGFTFGEAAYASQNSLSWQATVVGDPLYRPFGRPPQVQHEELKQTQSKLLEWSHLRVVNLLLTKHEAPEQLVRYLQDQAITGQSAVLQEKLGELYFGLGDAARSATAYTQALQNNPTPQQRIRLLLLLGSRLELRDRDAEALDIYQQFCKDYPEYPDLGLVYLRMAPLAEKLGKTAAAEQYRKESERLRGTRQ